MLNKPSNFLDQKKSLSSFFQQKQLQNIDLLCIVGFSEEVVEVSRKWLQQQQQNRLIFIEEDPKVLESISSDILQDPQIQIHFLETTLQLEPLIKKICWTSPFSRKEVVVFEQRISKERFVEISSLLEKISIGVELTLSEFSDFGVRSFSNIFRNLFSIQEEKNISSLEGAYAHIPAIICGASPSLQKDLPHLRKAKNKALIFAGGTALNVLSSQGIFFHFAAGIDKEAPYERFKMQNSWEIPFFYQNQISSLNFSLVHAPPIRVGGYSQLPLEQWLENRLGFFLDFFDSGWTVATFLLSLAAYLGCNPIIMVGMDFSFHQQLYAKGVIAEKRSREFLSTLDRKGKKVWTQKDWLMARSWIEDFAQNNKGVTFIDASGGLAFRGIARASLAQIVQNFQQTLDLSSKVHATLASLPMQRVKKKTLLAILKELEMSLQRIEKKIEKGIDKRKKGFSFSWEEIESSLLEEKCYTLLLDPLWKIWAPLFEREGSLQELFVHRILFLKRVAQEHRKMMEKIRRES